MHGKIRSARRILVGSLKETDHFRDIGVDRRIILQWILRRQGLKMWTGLIWLKIGSSGRFL
jgi:hypothetical protein